MESLDQQETVWRQDAWRSHLWTVAIVIAVLSWLVAATWELPWTPLRWLGLALFAVATVLVLVARVQLGAAFTPRAVARRLVTTGLYARLQNPIYLFATIALLGLALFLAQPWLLAMLAVVIPVQLARIHRERRVLSEAFGEEYARYREQTWF